jgi:hypothetical protein
MIEYFVTSQIWLSLEDYRNQGLTSKEIENCIGKIPDPFSNLDLRCDYNIVRTSARHPSDIQYVVDLIEYHLDNLLEDRKNDT